MKEETHHVLLWGALRFLLGVAQMTLAPLGIMALLTVGLEHWVTWTLFAGATSATITSRVLYGGKRDPHLKRNEDSEK